VIVHGDEALAGAQAFLDFGTGQGSPFTRPAGIAVHEDETHHCRVGSMPHIGGSFLASRQPLPQPMNVRHGLLDARLQNADWG
jgi:hypothetical protein